MRENAGSLDPALSDGLAMIEESTHHDDVVARHAQDECSPESTGNVDSGIAPSTTTAP